MMDEFLKLVKEMTCTLFAMLGVVVAGIGLQHIYEPLVYIYAGIFMVYIENLGMKKKL